MDFYQKKNDDAVDDDDLDDSYEDEDEDVPLADQLTDKER